MAESLRVIKTSRNGSVAKFCCCSCQFIFSSSYFPNFQLLSFSSQFNICSFFIFSICTICPIFFVVENLPDLGFLALDGFPVKRYIWESDSEWIGFALREAAPRQPGRCKHLWNSLLKIHLTSFCQPDSIKRRFCAFPYHVGGCTLDVTFNYLEYNGRSALLIGLIMSTQPAIVSFYDPWCATSSLAQPYQQSWTSLWTRWIWLVDQRRSMEMVDLISWSTNVPAKNWNIAWGTMGPWVDTIWLNLSLTAEWRHLLIKFTLCFWKCNGLILSLYIHNCIARVVETP